MDVDNNPTPDASFRCMTAQEGQEWELAKAKLQHQQDCRDAKTIRWDFGGPSSRDTQSSGHNLDESIMQKYFLFWKPKK